MTTRTSLNNLEALAAYIASHTGKKYQVGRIYGLSWSFVELLPEGGRRNILTAATKAMLYDLMSAYFQGVRDAAAPQLLAALEAVEMWGKGYGTKTQNEIMREYVTPAINKAKGI